MGVYYVDQKDGNDTTGSGTSDSPWKTIQKALDYSDATARTINVRKDVQTGEEPAHIQIKTTHNWTSCVVVGCDSSWNPIAETDDTRPLVRINDTMYTIRNNLRNGTSIEFRYLRFVNNGATESNNAFINWEGNAFNGGLSLKCVGCLFTISRAETRYFFTSSLWSGVGRTCEFDRCTVDADSATYATALVRDWESWIFRNGTWIQPLTTASSMLSVSTSTKDVLVTHSTLRARTFANTSQITTSTTDSALVIRNCDFTGCNLVTAPKYWDLVVVRSNTLHIQWAAGVTFVIQIGTSTETEANPVKMAIVFNNNKMQDESGTPPSGAHYLMIGFKVPGLVAYNRFVQKYGLSADVDYGFVIKGSDVTVFWNWLACIYPLYAVGCQRCKFISNTAVAINSTYGFAFGMTLTAGGTVPPRYNIVINNVFVSSHNTPRTFAGLGGGLGPTYWAASDQRNLFNLNCWYCEGTNSVCFAQLETASGTGQAATFEEYVAKWAENANSRLFAGNEASSASYNPLIGGATSGGWKNGVLGVWNRPPVVPPGSAPEMRIDDLDFQLPLGGAGGPGETNIHYIDDTGWQQWKY